MMIDIHSHLIYGVDDGPSSIKESIRMVLEAEKLGINDIIATPHFNENLYCVEKVQENFQKIKARTADCDIELHIGFEVFIGSLIAADNATIEKLTLDGSRYILIELPFAFIPAYTNEVIHRLHAANFIPIIAHPERNMYFVRNFDTFINFIENSCMIQVDTSSIAGIYGSNIRNFVKKLIKLNLVHFVASDSHCADDYKTRYSAAYNRIMHWAGEEYSERLFIGNSKKILGNCVSRW